MSRMTKRQEENLHDRIKQDARFALGEVIANGLRYERVDEAKLHELKLLAKNRDEIVRTVVDHLLKHYIIRDRRR